MPETSGSVLERVETLPDWDKAIPCSGTGHTTGMDKHLHGDPSMPAEWLVRQQCPSCKACDNRPVCTFFKEHGITADRFVTCTKCRERDAASEFFTVLRKL